MRKELTNLIELDGKQYIKKNNIFYELLIQFGLKKIKCLIIV